MNKSVEQMAQEILDACAGQSSDDAHKAMMTAMACHIGGLWRASGKSLRQAQEAITDMAEVVNNGVVENWGIIDVQAKH